MFPVPSPSAVPDPDDGAPRMVTLFRGDRELVAVGADDQFDAAKQCAVLILQQKDGLRVGDVIQITRI
jgi:hypothetical protein